ncbi:nucleotide cyclase [Lucifera butyrica]|uniref:Nucleotide cyclase n=1 Tax=Lucifera butyrica TaxID=1351585 RepID=A0A498R5I1_9FIRM|nr:GGDEF domain-containing response regulator [Lucifera butyrica]VBB06651.1 nucleotide cyclase [Lucifera butyrica]
MLKEPVSVLVIGEENQYLKLSEMLVNGYDGRIFSLHRAASLSTGITMASEMKVDVVLLILSLPDQGKSGPMVRVRSQAPGVPVVVIGGCDDAVAAADTLREGAQDFLVNDQFDGNTLGRSILFAMERQKVLRELENASLIDELTGVHNRRGFITFGRHHLKVANRSKRSLVLCYTDVDNMKQINDQFGHHVGDQVLIRAAETLKEIFRSSDIVARIGGDEFVALALDTDTSFPQRIAERLKEKETIQSERYSLSLSVGFAVYDPEKPCTIEELLIRADRDMYEMKRKKEVLKKQKNVQSLGISAPFSG